jgi:hypothetical protein
MDVSFLDLFHQSIGVAFSAYGLFTYVTNNTRLGTIQEPLHPQIQTSKNPTVVPVYREIVLQDRDRVLSQRRKNLSKKFFKFNINTVLLVIILAVAVLLVDYLCEVMAALSSDRDGE